MCEPTYSSVTVTLAPAGVGAAMPGVTGSAIVFTSVEPIAHRLSRALASALAQIYSPLEIVVSDDGPSDGTCAIVDKALRAYRGPHTVRFHRSPTNRDLGGHVATLPSLARRGGGVGRGSTDPYRRRCFVEPGE